MIDYGHFGECFSMFEYQCQVCVYISVFWYESVSLACPVLSDEAVLFCIYVCVCSYVWMAPEKIRCLLTGSPSVNKVFSIE